MQSLCFNALTDSDVVFDSIFEPVFWTVDYVTRWFGLVSEVVNLTLPRVLSALTWKKVTGFSKCQCLVLENVDMLIIRPYFVLT